MSSKGIKCFALAAAFFVAAVSPAAAQETDPLPAPPLPAPDPAPPAPAPTRPRPAPTKPAATAPAPVRTPRYVAPAVVTPAPQTRPAPSAPVRAKKPARKEKPAAAKPVEAKPVEALRRLPIRDASIPATGERALVLAAAGFVPAVEHDDGLGTIALAAVFWFGLAVALLLIAYVAPLQVVPRPLGTFLYERRNQFALVGVNMVAAAVVCYLVVATS